MSLTLCITILQNDLGLSRTQSVHVVSHCPYLIAQYSRYKGRDIFATASAFLDVGYTLPKLVRATVAHYFQLMTAHLPVSNELDSDF
jgi:S-adenosylmethionine hydrolase